MLYHIMLISYHIIQMAIAYSQHTQFEKGEPQLPFVHEPTQLRPSTPLKPMNAFLRELHNLAGKKNAPLHMLDERITHLCLGCVCFKIANVNIQSPYVVHCVFIFRKIYPKYGRDVPIDMAQIPLVYVHTSTAKAFPWSDVMCVSAEVCKKKWKGG